MLNIYFPLYWTTSQLFFEICLNLFYLIYFSSGDAWFMQNKVCCSC